MFITSAIYDVICGQDNEGHPMQRTRDATPKAVQSIVNANDLASEVSKAYCICSPDSLLLA